MAEKIRKQRDLKYMYVQNELGVLVNAKNLTEQDRIDHKFYIEGFDTEGNKQLDPVILVLGKQMRNHFRRHKEGLKATLSGEIIHNVKIGREYHESVIHCLVKQMLADGRIDWIALPDNRFETSAGAALSVKNEGGFFIHRAESERRFNVDDTFVVFDILATNTINNKTLAIEICVNHKCDEKKIEKLKKIGIDTIEIDFSWLVESKFEESGDLEEEIKKAFMSAEHTVWLNHTKMEKFKESISGIVTITHLDKSRYADDGAWIKFKDMVADKLPNCPRILHWDGNTDTGNSNRYLKEVECRNCPRFMGEAIDANGQRVAYCNQSDFNRNHIVGKLMSFIK